jgi:hypothetical protein
MDEEIGGSEIPNSLLNQKINERRKDDKRLEGGEEQKDQGAQVG